MKPISKSQFTLSLQCKKAFYLYRFKPELREVSPQQEALFAQGRRFEPYMQHRFAGGIDVSTLADWNDRFALTEELIAKGDTPVFEATLRAEYKGVPLLCMIDMLVPTEAGWEIYEIKSSTRVKPEYLPDVAFQVFVAKLAGLTLSKAHVVHLNNQYVRRGELDPEQLGTTVEVTAEALAMQTDIGYQIDFLKATDDLPFEPQQRIGPHCSQPYDCAFMQYCWQDVPQERSVFDYFTPAKAFQLYDLGYETIDSVPEDFPLPTKDAFRLAQVRANKLHVDKAAVNGWLAQLRYPLYYMDFETFMPAIPLFDESRPYQQIPFQFSVHVQEAPGAPVTHHAFLAEADGTDPRPAFIKELLACLGREGSIVVYNQGFEMSRIRELAFDFPHYASALNSLLPRVADLLVPFRSLMVYHPEMKGTASIKSVLPALAPELSYADLSVASGSDAMTIFPNMLAGAYTPAETAQLRQALLTYCERDTEGMVELVIKLRAIDNGKKATL